MRRDGLAMQRLQAFHQGVLIYLYVAVGAAIGGVARALVSLGVLEVAGHGFPLGTLVANVAGSFLIGFYATLTEPGGRLVVKARTRQFVMTGICGGFTTFSIFSLETFRFIAVQDYPMAAANVGVSVVAWMLSVWAGAAAAARLNQL
ncbi:MAG: CrcB family protein [Paracoccaceae bacterium]